MRVTIILLCLFPVLSALVSCAQNPTSYRFQYDDNNFERPKFSNNILIMQTDVAIKERFPGGVIEDIPSWTHTTNQILTKALKQYLATTLGIHSTILQPDKNTSLVNNHRALLKLVNREIREHTRGWNNCPINKTDLTIRSVQALVSSEIIKLIPLLL